MADKKTLAIIGCDADEQIVTSLLSLGFLVQSLPRHKSLPTPVSSHADMLMFELEGQIFAQSKYIEEAKPIFDTIASYGYNVVPCDTHLGDKYPLDIAFNIAKIGKSIYGNSKYNSETVIEFAASNGFEITDVKQGYTKCSTVVLGSRAIITADDGIARATEHNGVAVLKINNSPESVTLNGYNYGFIGGACGVFNDDIYFTGNIDLHPEASDIKSFCESFGYGIVSLTNSALIDVGGIIFLPYIC